MAGLAAPAYAADAVPVQLNVALTDGADAAAVLAGLGDAVKKSDPIPGLNALRVEVLDSDVATVTGKLAADSAVRYAEPNHAVRADADPLDQMNRNYWGGQQVQSAWTWTTGSPDITVAVVDSGVNTTPDLSAADLTAGYDFVDGDAIATDDDDHGTMIANIIAARENGKGGTGVCRSCQIMPIRVLAHNDATGRAEGRVSEVSAGIVWAADHGAKIINLSLSGNTPSKLLADAVKHAEAKGALVVASAGTSTETPKAYPAAIEPVLAVGSVTHNGQPSRGTRVNTEGDRWIDVAGPDGAEVLNRVGVQELVAGPSVSTAVVSGAAALAFATKPDATASEVRSRIVADASQAVGYPAWNAPVLDAARLLHSLGAKDQQAPVLDSLSGLPAAGQVLNFSSKRTIYPVLADDHAIERVEFRVNGELVDTDWAYQTGKNLQLSAPKGFVGDLPISAKVYDYAGQSDEFKTTVKADGEVPEVKILSPAEGAHVTRPVRVEVEVPGDDIRSVQVNRSGYCGFAMTKDAATGHWIADVRSVSNDWIYDRFCSIPPGTISITAEDVNENITTVVRKVVVDVAGPTATSISPNAGAIIRGSFNSRINGVSDSAGVASARLYVNGKSAGTDATAPYEVKVWPGSYSGSLKLTWELTDGVGDKRTYTRYVVADNKAPTVSITKAPKNKAKIKGTQKVYVKASDSSGISRVELMINGKVVARDTKAGYVLSFNASKQAKGMKVLVRVYDKAGNVTVTMNRTWYRK